MKFVKRLKDVFFLPSDLLLKVVGRKSVSIDEVKKELEKNEERVKELKKQLAKLG